MRSTFLDCITEVIDLGHEQRYAIYDMFREFPEPLVTRDLRLEVGERTDRDGNEVAPLHEDELRRALKTLAETGCEAVAISFINAYRNPAHERRAGEIAAAEFPELAVSLSAQVVAEIGEYPRTVTTCANSYVKPLMARYLSRLEAELAARGFRGKLRLMHSAGGLVSPDVARAFPIRLLESGPAGGGLAAALFGETAGKDRLIAFDMGGTTAKACLIEDGTVDITAELEAGRVSRFRKGSGLPIRAPVLDMIEVVAGGGSIACIDAVALPLLLRSSIQSRLEPLATQDSRREMRRRSLTIRTGNLNAIEILIGTPQLIEHIDNRLEQRPSIPRNPPRISSKPHSLIKRKQLKRERNDIRASTLRHNQSLQLQKKRPIK